VFEPRVDPTVLYTQLFVLAAAAGAGAYWWYTLVPTLRRNLAKEKRSGGEVNKYLVEIQADESRGLERWFYTDWLQQLSQRQQLAAQAAAKRAAAAASVTAAAQQQPQDASLAASLITAAPPAPPSAGQSSPSLQPPPPAAAAGGAGPSEPAEEEEDNKEPSFWSLDNPILATAAALSAMTLVSVVLHR
jgi:hypothetical protein